MTPNETKDLKTTLGEFISLRSFIQGLILSSFLAFIIHSFIYAKKNQTLEKIEAALSHRTISITKIENTLPDKIKEAASQKPEKILSKKLTTTASPSDRADIERPAPSVATQMNTAEGNALYPAPIQGLYESSPTGPLPIISNTNLTPFEVYKKPFTPGISTYVSIAIKDFGLSEKLSGRILETLPNTVTLILSPYAKNIDDWQSRARAKGFETWLFVPVENKKITQRDIGSLAITTNVSNLDNKDAMHFNLARTAGYTGIVMATDTVMQNFNPFFNIMRDDVFGRGLGFFELNKGASNFAESIAQERRSPYLKNDLDLNQSSFKDLENAAKENGYAIAVIAPYPNAVKALETWTATLLSKGIKIAPLSAAQDIKSQRRMKKSMRRKNP